MGTTKGHEIFDFGTTEDTDYTECLPAGVDNIGKSEL